MKPALLMLCLLSPAAWGCQTTQLPLAGAVSVPHCPPRQGVDNCVSSGQLLHTYMEAIPDSDEVLIIALHSSPWRLYDADMRILPVNEFAASIKPALDGKVTRVELIGSWTGASPTSGVPSLADRLSSALGGFPVSGEDGFLWLRKDGSRRTTQQAFTIRDGGGSYFVPEGEELLAPLVVGWYSEAQDVLPAQDAVLQLRAAAGWDIFMLCPDNALGGFEHAAKLGSAVAAYNAAIMRLERGGAGDRSAALAMLERGAALGDGKSQALLALEREKK
ncbi:hypothetical protein [Stenotrophomonas terrae]|nr:hypothetical protein [Stenotrophomonas terrae]